MKRLKCYGPHSEADTPATVTVLPAGKYQAERQEPIPEALLRQRRRINDMAQEASE